MQLTRGVQLMVPLGFFLVFLPDSPKLRLSLSRSHDAGSVGAPWSRPANDSDNDR